MLPAMRMILTNKLVAQAVLGGLGSQDTGPMPEPTGSELTADVAPAPTTLTDTGEAKGYFQLRTRSPSHRG